VSAANGLATANRAMDILGPTVSGPPAADATGEAASGGAGALLYVPDDHGLLAEVDENHFDLRDFLANFRL
jgi:hypothetical protein